MIAKFMISLACGLIASFLLTIIVNIAEHKPESVEYIWENFHNRVTHQIVGCKDAVSISVFDSPLKSLGDLAWSVMVRGFNDGSIELVVSLVELSAAVYDESSSFFNSNSGQLTLNCATPIATRVTFVLAHNEAGDFTSREEARSAAFTFNSTCTGFTGEDSYFYTCPFSGEVLFNNCTGLTGVLTSYCPVRAPTCAIVNVATGAITTDSSDCEVLSFDLYSTTCSCVIQPSERIVLEEFKDLPHTGVLIVVSMTEFVNRESQNTFTPTKLIRRRLQKHM